LVLKQLNPEQPLPSKLSPKFLGPYEVIQQEKNDVTCKHLVLGHVKVYHVTRLKVFHGSHEEAYRAAMLDNDQYLIREIIAYRGEPNTRSTMEFEVVFEDNSVVWLPWTKDLFDSVPYENFCRTKPELFPVLHDLKTAKKLAADFNKVPITEVKPGDTVYVDLRCYGATWYGTLPLPDLHHKTYLLEYVYKEWVNKHHTKIKASCPIFGETFVVDHVFVRSYGSRHELPTGEGFVLVDEDLVRQHPALLPSN